MNLGILCAGYTGWGGGLDFIRKVIDALASLEDPQIELHVIVPDTGPARSARALVHLIRHYVRCAARLELAPPQRAIAPDIVKASLGEGRIAARFHHIDDTRAALASLARRQRLDVLLPAGFPLGADFPIPWAGHVDDFQYRYFPQYYQPAFRTKRDHFLSRMLTEPKSVVMLSETAAADARKFHPEMTARMVVLPLGAAPTEEWLAEKRDIGPRYGVGSRYFMICNQFWMSKRHEIAFSAIARLAAERPDVQLVCTGKLEEHRDPGHIPRLLAFLDEQRLGDRVRLLGFIPKLDQIALMKNSVAVIQPTAFEGAPGGLSVHEAIALGVPTIVSDIPVNREIEEWVTSYFPLDDVDALHQKMRAMLDAPAKRPAAEELRRQGQERRRRCAEALLSAAAAALE